MKYSWAVVIRELHIQCDTWTFVVRISSNNSRGRLLFFSHKKGAIIRGKAIISYSWFARDVRDVSIYGHPLCWRPFAGFFKVFTYAIARRV